MEHELNPLFHGLQYFTVQKYIGLCGATLLRARGIRLTVVVRHENTTNGSVKRLAPEVRTNASSMGLVRDV